MNDDQRSGFRTRRPNPELARAADPLRDFYVPWLEVAPADVDEYRAVIESATDEKPVQEHLSQRPMLLVQILDGGHGRWVLPHKNFGGRFEADFVLGHRWSGPTWEWVLVELQTPQLKGNRNADGRLFLKNGRMCEQLDEGLRQINEWRRWISTNLDMAKRSRADMGLGLTDIEPNPPGVLLIGREADLTPEHARMRKQLSDQYKVRIHSYDWLAREAHTRLVELGRIEVDAKTYPRTTAASLFEPPPAGAEWPKLLG